MKELDKKIKSAEFEKKMFVCKIHSLIKAKELSLFDVFNKFDVIKDGTLNQVELKTGM